MASFADRPAVPVSVSDLELLRRFEPAVRFTKGEQFYPMEVERYVRRCSLWVHHPGSHEEELLPEGELSMERLVEARSGKLGAVEFLRFVHPLTLAESAKALVAEANLHRKGDNVFYAGPGRLARGGLVPRIVDAGFSGSLLLRGTVPGATAAAALLGYAQMQEVDEKYVYYGRVVRHEGWTILQYWFFYAYNSWRSGFNGVNDHEADWEMITLYLYEQDGCLTPEWAAYASHDYQGADLRRRWDDQEQLQLIGGHPVVYAGAGSHASYFVPGEYQAEVSLPTPSWVETLRLGWRHFWTDILGQPDSGKSPLRIPFVDYARGDGLSIGAGQARAWTPVVIGEDTPWVGQFRGLWGLFARDPLSGENAPAGPMYNRDGTPRSSWFDPLGFGGLDRVPPPPHELPLLEQRIAGIDLRQQDLTSELAVKAGELQALGAGLRAMEGDPHLAKPYGALDRQLGELAAQVTSLRREQSQNNAIRASLDQRMARLKVGAQDPPRSHIRHLATPVEETELNRFFEAWAAVSLSLLLLGLAALLVIAPRNALLAAIVVVIAFIVFESILRRTFATTMGSIAVALAFVAAIILVVTFWKWVLVGALVAVAAILLWQRVRELRQ